MPRLTSIEMVRQGEAEAVNFFPDLPPYSSPTNGILSKVPAVLVPYGQLMRLDRIGGFYAFYFPYLIGLAYAACVHSGSVSPSTLLELASKFLVFNVFLRGAACTWNDTVDQDFDRRVARCRHRPIARGAVSTTQAIIFTIAQLAACYWIMTTLPDACLPHAIIATTLLLIYALMKRITYYPQVVLGFPFAWANFICVGALGMDPFQDHLPATLAMVAANVLWTITYDTIYAHQDVDDDEKAGVKGMALLFKNSTKLLASVLTFFQIVLLATCGVLAGFGPEYFVGTVGSVGLTMSYFIYDVDLKNPASCGAWFRDQFWYVGAGFLLGLLLQYAKKLPALVA